jgi:hypothetical protein
MLPSTKYAHVTHGELELDGDGGDAGEILTRDCFGR